MKLNLYAPTLWIAALVAALGNSRTWAEERPAQGDKAVPAASAKDITGWIAQLDDNRYLVREQASQRLIAAGAAVLDPLLVVANGPRAEPADRAVWILRRLARSSDNEQAIAALERLVQLSGRPALVEKADMELAQRTIAACQAKLSPLGAELTMEMAQIDVLTAAPLLHVRLGEKWRGTSDDLRCIAQFRRQMYYRIEGNAVDNAVVKFFEDKEKLAILQLWNTRVTPEAIDALKDRHPETLVYMRGEALMGVEAQQNVPRVVVTRVAPGTGAAAAGILANDVIAAMDGKPLPDFDRLTAHIAQHRPGDTVEVELVRGDTRQKVMVTLGSRPEGE